MANANLQAGNTHINLRGTDVLDAALAGVEDQLAVVRAAEQAALIATATATANTFAPEPTSLEDRVTVLEARLANFNTRSGQPI